MVLECKFSIATPIQGSKFKQTKIIELKDNLTEEEIENKVEEAYVKWLHNHNYGFYEIIKEI